MQTRQTEIQPGWDAYGSDDQKIGTIRDVGSNYLVIEKGLIFTADIYVPGQAVDTIDADRQRAYLNVAKDAVDSQGWTAPPKASDEWEGWTARRTAGMSTPSARTSRDTSDVSSPDRPRRPRDEHGTEALGGAAGAVGGAAIGGAVGGPPGAVVGGALGAAGGAAAGETAEGREQAGSGAGGAAGAVGGAAVGGAVAGPPGAVVGGAVGAGAGAGAGDKTEEAAEDRTVDDDDL